MKTNITLKLEASLIRQAKVLAAQDGTSVSAMLGERLERLVRERQTYDRAKRRALARLQEGLDLHWTPGVRADLHER